MRIKIAARVAAVVASALVAVACTTPDVAAPPVTAPAPVAPGETAAPAEPGGAVERVITVGATGGLVSTNPHLPASNNASNNDLLWLVNGPGFHFFDDNLNTVRNTDFGTYSPEDTEFNADGSLTVTYTINEGQVWSDGVPVDAADMILMWGAMNNRFDTISEEAYAEQHEDDEDYIPLPEGQVYFGSGSFGMTDVPAFPIISDDGRTITFTFRDSPRADWFFQFGAPTVPAHVVGRLALGIEDPEEAKQAVISAFGGPENFRAQDGTEEPTVLTVLGPAGTAPAGVTTYVAPDLTALNEIANVFNNDFNFSTLPADSSLYLSRGPYVFAEIQDGEFIRLERNPLFQTAGNVVPMPLMDEITVRIVPDALAMATALQNHEVDIINPGNAVTADLLPILQGIPGVQTDGIPLASYEHITLAQNNGGVFSPQYWEGQGVADPVAAARATRIAFLQTIPRQQIVDLIVSQIDPNATTRDSWLFLPGAPGYDELIANNGIDLYDGGVEAARQTLSDAGLDSYLPLDVRFLYGTDNPRRVQQFALIQAAAPDLFNVIDAGRVGLGAPSETWGWALSNARGEWDAGLWGWGSTSTAFLNAEANTRTGLQNNHGEFTNERVDELWDEAQQETDPTRLREIATEMESILMAEGFGLPIFQFPGVMAYRDDVQNASSIMISPQHLWNFYQWDRAAAN